MEERGKTKHGSDEHRKNEEKNENVSSIDFLIGSSPFIQSCYRSYANTELITTCPAEHCLTTS